MPVERPEPRLESTSDAAFEALHAIALRGVVPAIGDGLLEAGLVDRVNGGFELTALGHSRHRAMLGRERRTLNLSGLEIAYGPMPALARVLARLRASWREVSGTLARRRLIGQLCELVEATMTVLRRASALAPRFHSYAGRLSGAVACVRGGDHAYAFGTEVDSIAAVWEELNEDLLQTLGRAHELDGG